MTKNNLSTKTKSKQPQTKSRVKVLYVLALFCLLLPLIHIEASNEYNEALKNITSFSSWRKLFFALGFPLAMLFLTTCLYLTKNYINNTGIKTAITRISIAVFVLCFFFIIWDLHPKIQDYSKWAYRFGSLAMGLVITYIYIFTVDKINETHSRAIELCRKLFSLINETRKKLPPENSEQLIKDLHKTIEG